MKRVITFLVLTYLSNAFGLIPIEGSIFGQVNEQLQQDPLTGLLSYDFQSTDKSDKDALLRNTYALYQNGEKLKNKCDLDFRLNYSNRWQENSAKRSVVATLQYYGIDIALKSIAARSKLLGFGEEKYNLLVTNLVNGSCSPNLSVYSLKLLKNNFKYYWDNPIDITVPKSQYLSSALSSANSIDTIKRNIGFDIKNFRAFCSWNSDTDDYRLMVPYLKNPYIMADLYNSLLKRSIDFDPATMKLIYKNNPETTQVACENLICRSRSPKEFDRIFPRMPGRTTLEDDLVVLYCDHFSKVRFKQSTQQINKWRSENQIGDTKKEALHYISNISKIYDLQTFNDEFTSIPLVYEKSFKDRWNVWADEKLKYFYGTQFYEESLKIELSQNREIEDILQGHFSLYFDINYGEIDKSIQELDKFKFSFNLSFTKAFLSKLKERLKHFSKLGDYEKLAIWRRKAKEVIRYQVKSKDQYFFVPLWNEMISEVITDELIKQLDEYRGNDLNLLDKSVKKVKVGFRVGVFAMQYIYLKRNQKKNDLKTLTFK